MKLDKTDIFLLDLLQQDSKQTTKALAAALGLSVTATYERIKRLEKNGVIKAYVALLNPDKLGLGLKVFCHIRLNQHIKDQVLAFEREIKKLEEVSACYHLGGEFDYLLEIHIADMSAYREFMVNKLTTIRAIGSTQSSFVIRQVKHTTALSF